MAKYDEEDWKKNGRTAKIGSDVDFDLKVVIYNQLEKENALDVTNSDRRVVSSPSSPDLAPGMRIVAEDGGFEQEEQEH